MSASESATLCLPVLEFLSDQKSQNDAGAAVMSSTMTMMMNGWTNDHPSALTKKAEAEMSKQVSKELIKELVDAPYGEAERILKRKGFWDEKRDWDPEKIKTFRVRVSGEVSCEGTVKVEARTEEEAEDLALDEAHRGNITWDYEDCGGYCAEVEEIL